MRTVRTIKEVNRSKSKMTSTDEANDAWRLIKENFFVASDEAKYVDPESVYNKWASSYESDTKVIKWTAPFHGSDYLARYADKIGMEYCAPILDIAAGTGIVGKELTDSHGFKNIDAIDGSSEMLKHAKELCVYRNITHALIGKDGQPLPFEDDSYQGVVLVGALGNTQISIDVIPDIIRVTSPGGIIVLVVRHQMTVDGDLVDLEPLCEKLESEGKWKLLVKEIPKNRESRYYMDYKAFVLVYQVD